MGRAVCNLWSHATTWGQANCIHLEETRFSQKDAFPSPTTRWRKKRARSLTICLPTIFAASAVGLLYLFIVSCFSQPTDTPKGTPHTIFVVACPFPPFCFRYFPTGWPVSGNAQKGYRNTKASVLHTGYAVMPETYLAVKKLF